MTKGKPMFFSNAELNRSMHWLRLQAEVARQYTRNFRPGGNELVGIVNTAEGVLTSLAAEVVALRERLAIDGKHREGCPKLARPEMGCDSELCGLDGLLGISGGISFEFNTVEETPDFGIEYVGNEAAASGE
jgi:hypothetical protein